MDWVQDAVGNNTKEPRLSDLVEVLVVPDGEGKEIRLIGPARRVAKHWIEINTKTGKVVRIPRVCLAYDDATGAFENPCPYCDIDPKTPGIEVHQNCIDRDAQALVPSRQVPLSAAEKEITEMKGYRCRIKRSKASKAYTPVRLAVMNGGHANPVKDMVGMNKHVVRDESGAKVKKAFGPEHPQYGFDVSLLYNSTRAAAQRYSAIKGENTVVEKEERAYLMWDIFTDKPKTIKEATRDAAELAPRVVQPEGAEPKAGAAKKASGKTRETTIDDDEDWDSDATPPAKAARGRAPVDEDDDDAPPPPVRGKPRRAAAEPEDEFDDEPAPARRSAKPARRAEPEDEFDDEPAPARRTKPARRAEPEDEFDDEEPAPRRSAKPAARRPVDEDEFDEPAPRRSAKPAARRAAEPEDEFDDEEPAPRRAAAPARAGKPKPRRPEPDDDDLGADDADDWGDD